jgi:phage terminase large subunit
MNDPASFIESLEALPAKERDAVKAALRREIKAALLDKIAADVEAVSLRCLANACMALSDPEVSVTYEPRTRLDTFKRSDDIRADLISRFHLLLDCHENPERQDQERAKCKADVQYFFDHYVWMLDPRVEACPRLPFRLFQFQRDVLDFISARYARKESGHIKKSRDMGLSVICIGFGIHLWTFEEGRVANYGSRKEALVHKLWDMDSLLEKARYMIRALPYWLRPSGYTERGHFNYLSILNPENGSYIKGEGGDQLGRGGRSSVFFADEFSHVKRQEASHISLSGTTDCVIYLGTSAGPQTYFYQMEKNAVCPFYLLKWWHDPRKVDRPEDAGDPKIGLWDKTTQSYPLSEWATKKRIEIGPAGFAREFDCDDSKALDSVVIPADWIWTATQRQLAAEGRTCAGLDLAGSTGNDEIVLAIRKGPAVLTMRMWEGIEYEELAVEVVALCNEHGADQLAYDAGGIGSSFGGPMAEIADTYTFDVIPVVPNAPATNRRFWDSPEERMNRHRFANLSAELWWSLRLRFQAAARSFKEPDSEEWRFRAITIPDDSILKQQLAGRERTEDGHGRIKLGKKPNPSPDRADALVLTEMPARRSLTDAETQRDEMRRLVEKARSLGVRREKIW